MDLARGSVMDHGYQTNQEPSPNQLRHLGELALGRLQAKNYYSRTDEG